MYSTRESRKNVQSFSISYFASASLRKSRKSAPNSVNKKGRDMVTVQLVNGSIIENVRSTNTEHAGKREAKELSRISTITCTTCITALSMVSMIPGMKR